MNTTNIKFTAHLTKDYQLQAADALISKLKMELGAANSYIDELEYDKQNLEKENEKLKALNKKLNDKYSNDVQEYLKTDELYHKYVKVIDEVIEEINRVKRRNDILVAEIMKLRNERNN